MRDGPYTNTGFQTIQAQSHLKMKIGILPYSECTLSPLSKDALFHKTTILLIFRHFKPHQAQFIVEDIALLQRDQTRCEYASVVYAVFKRLYT